MQKRTENEMDAGLGVIRDYPDKVIITGDKHARWHWQSPEHNQGPVWKSLWHKMFIVHTMRHKA